MKIENIIKKITITIEIMKEVDLIIETEIIDIMIDMIDVIQEKIIIEKEVLKINNRIKIKDIDDLLCLNLN